MPASINAIVPGSGVAVVLAIDPYIGWLPFQVHGPALQLKVSEKFSPGRIPVKPEPRPENNMQTPPPLNVDAEQFANRLLEQLIGPATCASAGPVRLRYFHVKIVSFVMTNCPNPPEGRLKPKSI